MIFVKIGDTVHIAFRRKGSTATDRRKTVCLMERDPEEEAFEETKDSPTCPFCIRDAEMPDAIRDQLARRVLAARFGTDPSFPGLTR